MSLADRLYYRDNKKSEGVKYVKINKFDARGNDNSSQLRDLKTFSIKYTDTYIVGDDEYLPNPKSDYPSQSRSVEYPILDSTEYPDYFLYVIDNEAVDTTFTSSLDYKVEDFSLDLNIPTASYLIYSGSSVTSSVFANVLSLGTSSVSNDPQNGLNSFQGRAKSSDRYFFTKSPTSKIKYELSFMYQNSGSNSPVYPLEAVIWKDDPTDRHIKNITPSGSSRAAIFASQILSPQYFSTSSFPSRNLSRSGEFGIDNVYPTASNSVSVSSRFVVRAGGPSGSILYDSSQYTSESIQASGVARIDPEVIGGSPSGYHITITGTDSNQSDESIAPSLRFLPTSAGYDNEDILVTDVNFRMVPEIGADTGNEVALILGGDYLLGIYENSDYNPIANNAEIILPSQLFQKVDRDQISPVPKNINDILNGDAEDAYVTDYNYYLSRHIFPRYNGSKYTSPDFNINSTKGLLNPPAEEGSIFFTNVLKAEGNAPEMIGTTFFTTDQLIDQNGNTKDPTVVGDQAFTDYKYVFPRDGVVNVNVTPKNGGIDYEGLNGEHKILANGPLRTVLVTNCGTASASPDARLDKLSFGAVIEEEGDDGQPVTEDPTKYYEIVVNGEGVVWENDGEWLNDDMTTLVTPNVYPGYVYVVNQNGTGPSDRGYDFATDNPDVPNGPGGRYTLNQDTAPVKIRVEARMEIKNRDGGLFDQDERIFGIYIQHKTAAGGIVAQSNTDEVAGLGDNDQHQLVINYPGPGAFANATDGDYFEVFVYGTRKFDIIGGPSSNLTQFKVFQDILPSVDEGGEEPPPDPFEPFLEFVFPADSAVQQPWSAINIGKFGGSMTNAIRLEPNVVAGLNIEQRLSASQTGEITVDNTDPDNPVYGAGFDLPNYYSQELMVPMVPQVGDQIRWGLDEVRAYNITHVYLPGTTPPNANPSLDPDFYNYIYMELDQNVQVGGMLNANSKDNFIIRRFLNNNRGLILDVPKKFPGDGGGANQSTITPKYITETLQDNKGEIIRDLISKNVIQ